MDDTTTATIHEAQLYWDAQDPRNAGWWLRYRDADGLETGTEIEGDADESLETLAESVATALDSDAVGEIRFLRGGDEPRGRIRVGGGAVVEWTAW